MNTLDPWGRLLAWLLPIKKRRNITGARAANGSDRETFRNIRFIPQFISLNGTNRFSQFNSWFCLGWRTSYTLLLTTSTAHADLTPLCVSVNLKAGFTHQNRIYSRTANVTNLAYLDEWIKSRAAHSHLFAWNLFYLKTFKQTTHNFWGKNILYFYYYKNNYY